MRRGPRGRRGLLCCPRAPGGCGAEGSSRDAVPWRRGPARAGSRGPAAAPPRDGLVRRAAGAARAVRAPRGRDPRPARRADDRPARGEVVPRGGDRPGAGRRADLLGGTGRGDRRPRGGGAGGVAGRPVPGRRARAAHLARVRALRARPRRDGRARGGAGGVARRPGEGPGRQRPGAAPGDAGAGRPAGPDPDAAARLAGQPRRAPRRAPRPRLHARPGGRGAGRVRAARRHRGRVPAVRRAPRPDRAVRRRDRLAARLRPDGPAERGAGPGDRAAPGDGVPPPAGRRGRDPGAAGADGRRGCRSGWRSTWRGSRGTRCRRARPT